jgi:hypothetical protein
MRTSLALLGVVSLSLLAFAQAERHFKYDIHDMKRPQPVQVDPGPAGAPTAPPSDAIVLFGASKPDLSAWTSAGAAAPNEASSAAAKWDVRDGAVVVHPGSGDIKTKDQFGDVQLHIEWMVPADAKVEGQHGGNSGVFFMDRFEMQVLSSNGNVTYADGMAGSVYGQYPPLVNSCRPQGQWNVYDIVFRAPVFDHSGALVHAASFTAFLNGVLVQDDVEVLGDTAHGARAKYDSKDAAGPIRLQDHGDPIRFRNIWARKLPARVGPE